MVDVRVVGAMALVVILNGFLGGSLADCDRDGRR